MKNTSKTEKAFLAITAITGTFALIGQLWLIILNRQTSGAETIIRYLSFFTIECNILVTVASAVILFVPLSKWGSFFSRPTTLCALTVYIFIVGLIYNLVLRQVWKPTGFQMVVDELLHVVMPALFLIYWLLWAPKAGLNWNISRSLIYPAAYAIYTFIRGAITGYYPYPFLDAGKFGTTQVALNTCGMVMVFLFFSLLFVFIGKKIQSNRGR